MKFRQGPMGSDKEFKQTWSKRRVCFPGKAIGRRAAILAMLSFLFFACASDSEHSDKKNLRSHAELCATLERVLQKCMNQITTGPDSFSIKTEDGEIKFLGAVGLAATQ